MKKERNKVTMACLRALPLPLSPLSRDVKGVEKRRLKGVVMVKEGFKVGLRLSLASDGGRLKLTALVLHISNPVAAIDEPAKAWMKSSLDGPANS